MTIEQKLELEQLGGVEHMQISKVVTSPRGNQFLAVVTGNSAELVNAKHHDGNRIIVNGGTLAVPLLGGIVDGIGDALGAFAKLMTCKLQTTTTVTCNDKGVVQSIVTTTGCAA